MGLGRELSFIGAAHRSQKRGERERLMPAFNSRWIQTQFLIERTSEETVGVGGGGVNIRSVSILGCSIDLIRKLGCLGAISDIHVGIGGGARVQGGTSTSETMESGTYSFDVPTTSLSSAAANEGKPCAGCFFGAEVSGRSVDRRVGDQSLVSATDRWALHGHRPRGR